MLKIGGIQKFSTLDYPGKMSVVLFLQGCQWSCEFCHNAHLQPIRSNSVIEFESVLPWLQTRKGKLDAVVFSGGEPLLQNQLGEAMKMVKELGFKVGLHTSGAMPKRLQDVLCYVDWVGLDFKHHPDKIPGLVHSPEAGSRSMQALEIISQSKCSFEVRTTIHSKWHTQDDLVDMADILFKSGIRSWVLQTCRPEGCPTKIQHESPKIKFPELQKLAAQKGVKVYFRAA